LANEVENAIKSALAEGVATLPLLEGDGEELNNDNHGGRRASGRGRRRSSLFATPGGSNSSHRVGGGEGGEQVLLRLLKRGYDKNVDLFEMYCSRNIFTLSMYKPMRQQQIVDAYVNDDSATYKKNSSQDEDIDMTDLSTAAVPKQEEKFPLPRSRKDIPTKEQLTSLEEEVRRMREELGSKKKQRQLANDKWNQLVVAEDLATKSKDTYVANAVEGMLPMQLSETTSSIVEGYEKLEHSLEHGKDLLQRMHELKEQRRLKNIRKKAKSNRFDSSDDGEISDDDDDDDSAIMETFPNDLNDEHGIKDSAAVPPLSLDDRYEQDRMNLMGGNGGTDVEQQQCPPTAKSLAAVYKMLVASSGSSGGGGGDDSENILNATKRQEESNGSD